MNRRDLLVLGSFAALPLAARAAQTLHLPVIATLSPGFPTWDAVIAGLKDGLRELGYVEGSTVEIKARWGLGKPETLPALAEELVRLNVNEIVALARPAINAARLATTVLPIVAIDLVSDPVAAGFVASFAEPKGNVTGLFLDQPELTGKWLGFIKEVAPDAKRIAVLWDTNTGEDQVRAISEVAKAISVDLQVLKFRNATEMQIVLVTNLKDRPDGLVQLGSPLINELSSRVASSAAAYRIPAISMYRSFCENGGLMSYGPNLSIWSHRLAGYVATILKGAKPENVPVEKPTNFEFVVNLKVAKSLGIDVPPEILAAANNVIE